MDSLDLAREVTDILSDKQAEDILILNLEGLTTITDYFVICTGLTRRQLRALESAVSETLKQEEGHILPRGVEGSPESGWILMDYGDVIVHIFDSEMRSYYDLEELWEGGRVVARLQ